jgi:molecular chaperone GrpE (heat shock protein)
MDEKVKGEIFKLADKGENYYRGAKPNTKENDSYNYCLTIKQLLSHIQSLESQLNVEWDDDRVKEIENKIFKYEQNEPDSDEEVNSRYLGLKYWCNYLLSLLKKERVEKKELEEGLKNLKEEIETNRLMASLGI